MTTQSASTNYHPKNAAKEIVNRWENPDIQAMINCACLQYPEEIETDLTVADIRRAIWTKMQTLQRDEGATVYAATIAGKYYEMWTLDGQPNFLMPFRERIYSFRPSLVQLIEDMRGHLNLEDINSSIRKYAGILKGISSADIQCAEWHFSALEPKNSGDIVKDVWLKAKINGRYLRILVMNYTPFGSYPVVKIERLSFWQMNNEERAEIVLDWLHQKLVA
jgi:hypothetical protein